MNEILSVNNKTYGVNNYEHRVSIELEEFDGSIIELLKIANEVKDKYNVPLDKIHIQGYQGCYYCGGQMILDFDKEKEEPKKLSIEEMKKLGEEMEKLREEFHQLCGEKDLKQNRLEEISEIFKQQKMGK